MNERCLGCYGSGRFGSCGMSDCQRPASVSKSQQCQRCHGTGLEPMEEPIYVRLMNRRVEARKALKAA